MRLGLKKFYGKKIDEKFFRNYQNIIKLRRQNVNAEKVKRDGGHKEWYWSRAKVG